MVVAGPGPCRDEATGSRHETKAQIGTTVISGPSALGVFLEALSLRRELGRDTGIHR
jgi:hypothetical protein